MRSSRPIRCSTTPGFQGRSNRISRRQNWKFRPSPPASVEIRIDGPSGSRNCATSMSRRSGERSSWKTPVAPPLPLDRRLEQVQRLAVGHEDQRLLVRPRPAAGLLDQPAHPRVRALGLGGQARRSPRRRGRAPRAGRRGRRGRGRRGPPCAALARALLGGLSAQVAHQPSRAPPSPSAPSRSTGAGTRGGRPPMSARRVELVQGGSGSRAGEALVERLLLGELLGAQELEQAEEAVGVVLERRGGEQQDVPARGRDGRDGPVRLVARVPRGAAAGGGPRRPPGGRSRPPPPARSAAAAATRVSSADDRLAVDVERVEAGAVVAWPRRPGASRRAGRRPGGTSARARPATGRSASRGRRRGVRSARPVWRRRLRIRQASTVLPRPTSSASSQRTGSLWQARSAA